MLGRQLVHLSVIIESLQDLEHSSLGVLISLSLNEFFFDWALTFQEISNIIDVLAYIDVLARNLTEERRGVLVSLEGLQYHRP